ncbi:nucleotidyl transferase AbiEii/AbiGii toxin family protein [Cellulosimicrobium sp. PMB13]|uniref:nucleotidyl transferase AbiEii/AbiGii toxin family protein n=1 Tax=Cellulosimicrobium sp. PMB13 TaxID=3120158 RepID=UPI003F4BF8EA
MSRPRRDSASGRAYLDLQNSARREGRRTQDLLTMYVVERWLARLARSPYAEDFVLKGGMLLAAFGTRRPTVDADALARNMAADEKVVAARVAEIAAIDEPDDGVEFLPNTVRTVIIRDDALYSGVRVTMEAGLGTARLKLRLDINFGDPVTPDPQVVELPALRPGAEPVRMLGYPVETVLAEKISTALDLGPASTRVRDWVDIYSLVHTHDLTARAVRTALDATAGFRGVALRPLSESVGDLVALRSATFAAFRRNLGPDGDHLPAEFAPVVDAVVAFADPVLGHGVDDGRWIAAERRWVN